LFISIRLRAVLLQVDVLNEDLIFILMMYNCVRETGQLDGRFPTNAGLDNLSVTSFVIALQLILSMEPAKERSLLEISIIVSVFNACRHCGKYVAFGEK